MTEKRDFERQRSRLRGSRTVSVTLKDLGTPLRQGRKPRTPRSASFSTRCSKTQVIDLFEKVRVLFGSEYIFDMRSERLLKTAKRVVATIELTLYSVKDLADMTEYLYERKMSDEDKAAVITYLKNAA